MNRRQASKEAATILRREANEIALIQNDKAIFEKLPASARVGLQREIERLREIAETLNPRP